MKNIPPFLLVVLGLIFWSIALYCSISPEYGHASDVLPGGHWVVFARFWIGEIWMYLIYAQLILTVIQLIVKKHNFYPVEAMARFNLFIFMGAIFIGSSYLYDSIIMYKGGSLQVQLAAYARWFGSNWWWYIIFMAFPILVPLLFWSKKIRESIAWTIAICLLVNIGVILEKTMMFLGWIWRALSF
jgi:molybdopterin-containing oxidoreductase family membrane subunit